MKLSWSIASLTRGFSGLSSDTPRGDQAATKGSCQDEKAQWLYDLIGEVEEIDALGTGELPDSLNPEALAVRRVNMPEEIARWVFDIIRRHHAPTQYARLQGFARILLIVPATEYSARLVLATPLFVQFASSKPIGILTRRRLQRELSRRHGRRWRKWQPDLPPEDRGIGTLGHTDRGIT